MLQPSLCRARQKRLLEATSDRALDALVLSLPHHVYYLTGHLPLWYHQAAVVLRCGGQCWMLTADAPNPAAAADETEAYEANFYGTLRQEQPAVAAEKVLEALKSARVKRIGVDASPIASQLAIAFNNHTESVDAALWQVRRQKDPDELILMKTAVACTAAMYARAKHIIEPGIPELHVFEQLQAAAVEEAGQPLNALLGNDFACGVPGGPPRKDHVARDGQLYILDLGPCFRGYFADNCRTFAVNRKPTDAQHQAWEAVVGALGIVERIARPGVRCRDLFAAADEHLKVNASDGMVHHLGHGVGLQPHEFPHLNPKWDDVLLEGEVFTAEPGLYAQALAGGLRLEQQYVVTATGVSRLTDFPLELL